jgi:hypothetical protein
MALGIVVYFHPRRKAIFRAVASVVQVYNHGIDSAQT